MKNIILNLTLAFVLFNSLSCEPNETLTENCLAPKFIGVSNIENESEDKSLITFNWESITNAESYNYYFQVEGEEIITGTTEEAEFQFTADNSDHKDKKMNLGVSCNCSNEQSSDTISIRYHYRDGVVATDIVFIEAEEQQVRDSICESLTNDCNPIYVVFKDGSFRIKIIKEGEIEEDSILQIGEYESLHFYESAFLKDCLCPPEGEQFDPDNFLDCLREALISIFTTEGLEECNDS